MSYPINYPTPQGANVQIFRGGIQNLNAHIMNRTWVKPQGASFVWFTLIGGGGGGGGGYLDSGGPTYYPGGGGASGNVTNFMCPAFLLPDELQVRIGNGGDGSANATDVQAASGNDGGVTEIRYQQKDASGYTLLQASGGGGGVGSSGIGASGGTASSADGGGPMTAAGFYNATGGQNGANGGTVITTNGLTFVMGGSGEYDIANVITGYYGYTATEKSGYSQLSPIPLAIPRATDTTVVKGGANSFGCGGNGGGNNSGIYSNGGRGGDGLAIIVTW